MSDIEQDFYRSHFSEQLTRERPPVIAVENLNHYFGVGEFRKQVLFDNCLQIGAGEIVIMTGPSGSGKTTLLTLIGGLRSVQEGTLQVNGVQMKGLGENERVAVRQSIGFIFQAHNLFASLTAYKNVKMALQLREPPIDEDEADERIKTMLTRLGLGHRIHYKPNSLSGGQRQRVAIARALVSRPAVVLADEPTAALDKASGRDVVNLLREFANEQKTTILMVTHDNRILDVADRIVNMVDGKIVSNVLVDESSKLCEFLQKCHLFEDLPPPALTALADRMIRHTHAAGSVICRQGEVADNFYLIRKGTVDIAVDHGAGEEKVASLGEGDFFGEVGLLKHEHRNATVTAASDLTLYALGEADFNQATSKSPSFQDQLRQVLYSRT